MRIAVYFSGHLRTAEYAADNLLNYMGDLYPNIDIFIHTWKQNGYKRLHYNSKFFQNMLVEKNLQDVDINKLDIKYFFPTQAPNTFDVISNLNKKYDKKIVSVEVEQPIWHMGFFPKYYGFPSRFYTWYRVNEMRKKYEDLNNLKYDVIVKLRPDALFSTDSKLKNDIEQCLNHQNNNSILFNCNDILFVSIPSVMDIASNFIVDTTVNEFSKYIEPLNIKVHATVTRKWSVYRPESIPASSLDFDYCESQNQGWYFPLVRGFQVTP